MSNERDGVFYETDVKVDDALTNSLADWTWECARIETHGLVKERSYRGDGVKGQQTAGIEIVVAEDRVISASVQTVAGKRNYMAVPAAVGQPFGVAAAMVWATATALRPARKR